MPLSTNGKCMHNQLGYLLNSTLSSKAHNTSDYTLATLRQHFLYNHERSTIMDNYNMINGLLQTERYRHFLPTNPIRFIRKSML